METQKSEFVAILNNLNSSTFAQYDQLTDLLGFLDNLITSLNGISSTSIGGRRKRSADCDSIKESLEEAIQFISNIIDIIDLVGDTGISALNMFLAELRDYLVGVRTTLESYVDEINAICKPTTTANISQNTTTKHTTDPATSEGSTSSAPVTTSKATQDSTSSSSDLSLIHI